MKIKKGRARRAIGAAVAGAALAVAGPIVAAPSASADTVQSIRHDFYPSGCGGYISYVATYKVRSTDGALMLTNLHAGNNMACSLYAREAIELQAYGDCTPPIYKVTNGTFYLSPHGGTVDWPYPFGSSEWIAKSHHPKWEWDTTAYGVPIFTPATGC